ncbi:MAG: hypothetical protein OXI63_08645 [Candidatus Poribacteria bacterium]|nr:hypothetical protein [Candidatus Poribacteria bacterium]
MKTLAVKKNKTVSLLTIFAFLVLATVPALGTTEFEIGTRFGISHLAPDTDDSFSTSTSITFTSIPSAIAHIGSSPPALYATWFPSKQLAIGPEFSLGRMSISEKYEFLGESETVSESITTLYLGGQAAYFLQSHAVSNPYVLGRGSATILRSRGEDETITSIGIGLGYQWRIRAAFVLRAEAQYQRVLVSDENANEFSLTIGIGTRFGNSKSQNP